MNDIHDIAPFGSVINLDLHNCGGGNLTTLNGIHRHLFSGRYDHIKG